MNEEGILCNTWSYLHTGSIWSLLWTLRARFVIILGKINTLVIVGIKNEFVLIYGFSAFMIEAIESISIIIDLNIMWPF